MAWTNSITPGALPTWDQLLSPAAAEPLNPTNFESLVQKLANRFKILTKKIEGSAPASGLVSVPISLSPIVANKFVFDGTNGDQGWRATSCTSSDDPNLRLNLPRVWSDHGQELRAVVLRVKGGHASPPSAGRTVLRVNQHSTASGVVALGTYTDAAASYNTWRDLTIPISGAGPTGGVVLDLTSSYSIVIVPEIASDGVSNGVGVGYMVLCGYAVYTYASLWDADSSVHL